jgi:hypothetical protein
MVPAGKSKPEAQVVASSPLPVVLTTSSIAKEGDLTRVLPLTANNMNEWGETLIWAGSAERNTLARTVYPFFLHSIFLGPVPPLSEFFCAILRHYEVHTLHLQPNSILLLSIFAFYCEAFVGVRPSVALFRHFFSLQFHDQEQCSACASFVMVHKGNVLLKAWKKVEGF